MSRVGDADRPPAYHAVGGRGADEPPSYEDACPASPRRRRRRDTIKPPKLEKTAPARFERIIYGSTECRHTRALVAATRHIVNAPHYIDELDELGPLFAKLTQVIPATFIAFNNHYTVHTVGSFASGSEWDCANPVRTMTDRRK